jgi:hypothetical protein
MSGPPNLVCSSRGRPRQAGADSHNTQTARNSARVRTRSPEAPPGRSAHRKPGAIDLEFATQPEGVGAMLKATEAG